MRLENSCTISMASDLAELRLPSSSVMRPASCSMHSSCALAGEPLSSAAAEGPPGDSRSSSIAGGGLGDSGTSKGMAVGSKTEDSCWLDSADPEVWPGDSDAGWMTMQEEEGSSRW